MQRILGFLIVMCSAVAGSASAMERSIAPQWHLIAPVEERHRRPRRSETPFVTKEGLDAIRADACVAHAGLLWLERITLKKPVGGLADLTIGRVSPELVPLLAPDLEESDAVLQGQALVLLQSGRKVMDLIWATKPMMLVKSVELVEVPNAPPNAPKTHETPMQVIPAEVATSFPEKLWHLEALQADVDIVRMPSRYPVRLLVALTEQSDACRAKVDAWSAKLGAHQAGQPYRVHGPHEDG